MWHFNKQLLYIFVMLKVGLCCDCNKRPNSHNDTKSNNMATRNIKILDNSTLSTPYKNIYTKEEEIKEYELNLTSSKADVADYETNEGRINKDITCPASKKGITRNLDRIADVWQTVYYRTTVMLSCFKIYIRTTTADERKYYAQTYGDFNGGIRWNDCLLEIRSNERHYSLGRKHFLQGSTGKGIFENMIILEGNMLIGNSSNATLSAESPDQWMVFKNILMMRDCFNGDIIIFTRVPHEPRLDTILHSLQTFGEESPEGVVPCIENGRIGRSIKMIPKEILTRYFRILYGYK